jgi:hypothetical protein
MAVPEKEFNLEKVAETLALVVIRNLNAMIADGYRDQSTRKKRSIVEYEGKLRASGMDVFNGATYISCVSYYLSEKAKETHSATGTLILYLRRTNAESFLKSIGYRGADDEKEDDMMGFCGQFCEVIAKDFRQELHLMGYPELVMTKPDNYLNGVPLGIDFNKSQYDQFEISFPFKGEKALVFEMTMAPLPQLK